MYIQICDYIWCIISIYIYTCVYTGTTIYIYSMTIYIYMYVCIYIYVHIYIYASATALCAFGVTRLVDFAFWFLLSDCISGFLFNRPPPWSAPAWARFARPNSTPPIVRCENQYLCYNSSLIFTISLSDSSHDSYKSQLLLYV